MVVELRALILDEGVVDRGEEVVGRRGAVVLLRVEPARGESSVPREDQLPLGRGADARRERYGRRGDGDRYQGKGQHPEHVASPESETRHGTTSTGRSMRTLRGTP